MITLHTGLRRGLGLAVFALTAACSTDVTAPPSALRQPTTASAAGLTDALAAFKEYLETAVLERAKPIEKDITVKKTIGKEGGTLRIESAGFELVVPAGAVKKNTTFTVTALAGRAIAYEFGPHGTTFAKPLQFRQNAAYTVGWWNASTGGYFKATGQVDTQNLKAQVDEHVGLYWSGSWMVLDITHFSGYLVSCA